MHSYIYFSNRISIKMCVGMHLSLSSAIFVYFLVLPSLLSSSINLIVVYTYFYRAELQQVYQAVVWLSSSIPIAAEAWEWPGLKLSTEDMRI